MDNEIENEIPPPPNAPHPNNVNASNAVNAVKASNAVNAVKASNAVNAVKASNAMNAIKAPNAVNGNTNKTSTVTAYVPQQKGETVTFRQFTVETKIIDETREYTI